MTANYIPKRYENQLIKIVKEHVEPCDEISRINLTIFHTAMKLGKLFIRNKLYSGNININERHHVVYYIYNKFAPEIDVTPLKATLVRLIHYVVAVLQIDSKCIRKIAIPLKTRQNAHNLNKVTTVHYANATHYALA